MLCSQSAVRRKHCQACNRTYDECCAANLLRTANVSPTDSRRRVAAGRRWLRSYINGCGNKVWKAALHASLKGKTFSEAAEWTYRTAGFVLIGQLEICV